MRKAPAGPERNPAARLHVAKPATVSRDTALVAMCRGHSFSCHVQVNLARGQSKALGGQLGVFPLSLTGHAFHSPGCRFRFPRRRSHARLVSRRQESDGDGDDEFDCLSVEIEFASDIGNQRLTVMAMCFASALEPETADELLLMVAASQCNLLAALPIVPGLIGGLAAFLSEAFERRSWTVTELRTTDTCALFLVHPQLRSLPCGLPQPPNGAHTTRASRQALGLPHLRPGAFRQMSGVLCCYIGKPYRNAEVQQWRTMVRSRAKRRKPKKAESSTP